MIKREKEQRMGRIAGSASSSIHQVKRPRQVHKLSMIRGCGDSSPICGRRRKVSTRKWNLCAKPRHQKSRSRSISQVKFESLDLKDPKDTVLLECLSFVYMVEWLEWNAASVGPAAAAAVGSYRNWTGRRCSGGRWSTADSRCSAFSGSDGRRKPATDQRRAVRLWGWWHVLWRMGGGKGPRARSVYGAEAPGGILWRLELRIRGIGSLYLAKVSQFCGI